MQRTPACSGLSAGVLVNVREPGSPAGDSSRERVPVPFPAFRSPRTVAEDVATLPAGQGPWRHILTGENHRVVQKSPSTGDQSKWSIREGMTPLSDFILEGRNRSD